MTSIAVWTIWLIPYFCGMLMGIPAIDFVRERRLRHGPHRGWA